MLSWLIQWSCNVWWSLHHWARKDTTSMPNRLIMKRDATWEVSCRVLAENLRNSGESILLRASWTVTCWLIILPLATSSYCKIIFIYSLPCILPGVARRQVKQILYVDPTKYSTVRGNHQSSKLPKSWVYTGSPTCFTYTETIPSFKGQL